VALRLTPDVPLGPLTTLELGGPARWLAEVAEERDVAEALALAEARRLPALVLGGGSNVVLPDAGFPGLVIRMGLRGIQQQGAAGGDVLIEAAAGEPWDALVAETVTRGLAGLECLSGIPGQVGATPIQNVGAYGQEVADTIRAVRVLDRRDGKVRELGPQQCQFSYRDSAFRRDPEGQVVLAVTFALRPGPPAPARYPELGAALASQAQAQAQAAGSGPGAPSLADVRRVVIALRRRKSMVIDAGDPNRRSVGSFFTNPIVSQAEADRVVARALAQGIVTAPDQVPRFPAGAGQVKLAAGWLIERAGITRGLRQGPVGVSSAHALALVHHGGGTSAQLLALARQVRAAVAGHFGITLQPEPIVVGARGDDRLLPAEALGPGGGDAGQ
jgi:UDP-N-acetylmuramate dehydrogenase